MIEVTIQQAFASGDRGTVIIVDADQGDISVGDLAVFEGLARLPGSITDPVAHAEIRAVESYDRPPSWGLLVDADVQDLMAANIGSTLTIKPGKDS